MLRRERHLRSEQGEPGRISAILALATVIWCLNENLNENHKLILHPPKRLMPKHPVFFDIRSIPRRASLAAYAICADLEERKGSLGEAALSYHQLIWVLD